MQKDRVIYSVVLLTILLWWGSALALDREQETIYDFVRPQDIKKSDTTAGKRAPGFPTYCWRVMTAPLVVMFAFPFDEETNIYYTYLNYINRNSDRHWRKKEYMIKKEGFVTNKSEDDAEQDPQPSAT